MIYTKPEEVKSFEQLKHLLEKEHRMTYLGPKTERVSNRLYKFSLDGLKISHILKELPGSSEEVVFYSKRLPLIREEFSTLQLPKAIGVYKSPESVFLLLPYYDGDRFDFSTPDLDLAKRMVGVVEDLLKIDVERVIGGINFDHKGYEKRFWGYFEIALSLGLITSPQGSDYKEKATKLWKKGRKMQKMIISNGDFNPRNLIRLSNGKLILIDWDGIAFPLEHHLTYPWLLNWENPAWQRKYATEFEKRLPVRPQNIRLHLMDIALRRAVDEKRHKNDYADRMAENHMKNFHTSMRGFNSLIELC